MKNNDVDTKLRMLLAQAMRKTEIEPLDIKQLDEVLEIAQEHGLAALLSQWFEEFSSHERVQELRPWRAEFARNTLLDQVHRDALCALAASFSAKQLRALVIKGTALAQSHYPLPGLRPRVDTDVLIEAPHAAAAHQCLLAQGYQPIASNFSATVLPERTYQKRIHGISVSLDLHWSLSARPLLARALPFEALYAQSLAFDNSTFWRMPCAIDALLIALVHRIGHHRQHERYIWLYDIHLLWQAMSQTQREQSIVCARERHLIALLNEGLKATQSIFFTEVSNADYALMRADIPEPCADLLSEDLGDFAFDWRHANAKERLALVLNRLWAQPEYLRQRYAAPKTPILLLQLRRWLQHFDGKR